MMRKELRKVFGETVSEKKKNMIIRDGICNVRKDLFETWMFPSLTRDKTRKLSSFVGRENLDAALEKNKGVILLLAHFGFRKLVLPALGYEGYAINQLAARPTSWKLKGRDNAAHNKLMDIELECEKALRTNFIYLDKSLRPVFRALNKNEIVVIAVDGPIGNKRIGTKFFNCTANFSPTAMTLSLKTGAPVVPAFVIRGQNNRHRIVIEKPLNVNVDDGAAEEAAVEKTLKDFTNILEKYVWEHPGHYVDWLYRAQLWPIDEDFFVFQ